MKELLTKSQAKLMIDGVSGLEELERAGIYGLFLNDEIIYIGKSLNLCEALQNYLSCVAYEDNTEHLFMYKYIDKITWSVMGFVATEDILSGLATNWIKDLKPILNLESDEEILENHIKELYDNDKMVGYERRDDPWKMGPRRLFIIDPKWRNKDLYIEDKKKIYTEANITDPETGKMLKWAGIVKLLRTNGYRVYNYHPAGQKPFSRIQHYCRDFLYSIEGTNHGLIFGYGTYTIF